MIELECCDGSMSCDYDCASLLRQRLSDARAKLKASEQALKAKSSELARMKVAKDSWKHDALVEKAEVARLRWKLTEALETLHVVHAYRGAQNAEALMLREVVKFLSRVKDQLPDALKKAQEGV